MASQPNLPESSSLPPTPQTPVDENAIMLLELPPPKFGMLPATKDSIEAMPWVAVTEEGTECGICLEAYHVGGEAREMPCKHRFHSDCIQKWLQINGSCPICRFLMPAAAEEHQSDDGEEVVLHTFPYPIPILPRIEITDWGSGSDSQVGDSAVDEEPQDIII